ncbi:MAG: DUF262 domain-containing protein [Akkermansiaceae bacterium]|nr:DUF262 domain-containing protein [Akkermansiaceae bacterium]
MNTISDITLWELLSGHSGGRHISPRILIPRIQRDYAHGREDKASGEIRGVLLDDLVRSLQPDGADKTHVKLGLVFGEENGGAIILYDGQQRFTTLFLLHWYVAWRARKLDEAGSALSHFSYDSRLHSRDFCHMLCSRWRVPAVAGQSPSEGFIESPLFSLAWRADPTVKGMLVVLDELHSKLSGEDASALWKALKSDRAPGFSWLKLEGQTSSGDLYIRLNSRGRPLSDFEKLKAWLEDHAKKGGWSGLPEGWLHKLDNEWLDLFWKRSGSDPQSMDRAMLAFFTGNAVCLTLRAGAKMDEGLIKNVYDQSFLSEDEWSVIFTQRSVRELFAVLELLEDPDVIQKMDEWGERGNVFRFAKRNDRLSDRWIGRMHDGMTYQEWLLLHGLLHFLLLDASSPAEWNESTFVGWMRFVRNLAWNTEPLGQGTFGNAAVAISGLEPYHLDDRLLEKPPGPVGLSKNQWRDEVLKADVRRGGNADPEVLAKAEDQVFLRGQIGFLIEFSTEGGNFDPGRFASYVDTMARLFPTGNGPDNRILLQRALLSAGDFVAEYSNHKWTLGGNREEWRWIFRDQADRHKKDGTRADRPMGILLDEGPSVDLEDFLNGHEKNLGWENWRKWMVRTPEPIGFCGGSLFGWKEEGHTVILVPNVNFSSTAELRTYVLFKSHLEGEGSGYHYAYGRNERSHLYWQSHSHRLELRYIGYLDAAEPFAFRLLGRRDGEVRLDGFREDERSLLPLDGYERENKWASYGIRRTSAVDPSLLAEEIRKIVGTLSRMEDAG